MTNPAPNPPLSERIKSMGQAMKPYLLSASGIAVLLAVVALMVRTTGCFDVDLESRRLAAPSKELPSGIIYQLPQTVADVAVDATIETCRVVKVKAPTEKEPARMLTTFAADFRVDYSITPRVQPDPSVAFVIPLNSLRGVLWSTATTIDLNAGSLKSINTTATAAKIDIPALTAKIEAFVQKGEVQAVSEGGAAMELTEETACGIAVMRAIGRRDELRKRLEQQTDEAAKKALRAEIDAQQAKLSRHSRAVINPRPGKPETMWLRVDLANLFQARGEALRDALMQNSLTFAVSGQWPAAAPTSLIGESTKGVVYRVPVSAKVVACRGGCTVDGATGQLAAGQIVEKETEWLSVPQLGREARLPVTMVPFSDRHLEVAFSSYGDLVRVGLSEKPNDPGGILVPGKGSAAAPN